MGFDRSKYKKASVESIEETVGKAAATMGGNFGQGGRASFFNLSEDGRYVLRVLPSLTGKPYMPRKTVKLPIECAVYDKDGKDTGKKEIRQKDIFTSDIHSNRMNPIHQLLRELILKSHHLRPRSNHPRPQHSRNSLNLILTNNRLSRRNERQLHVFVAHTSTFPKVAYLKPVSK